MPRSPLTQKLDAVEERIRDLRDERKPVAARSAEAKRKFAEMPKLSTKSPEYEAASEAKSQLAAIDRDLREQEDIRAEILGLIADGQQAGVVGFGGTDGWATLASELDVQAGKMQVTTVADSLLRAQAPGTTVTMTDRPTLTQRPVGQAVDRRYIYPLLPRVQVGPEALSIAEFRVTRSELSGNAPVLRDPVSTTEKAELPVGITYQSEDIKQVAVVVEDVPNAVLAADSTLQTLLQQQMRAELDRAIDDHVLSQIEAAGPLSGSTGADLVAQVRAGVGTLASAGFSPSLLALNPDDSAALDLTQTSGSGDYVFGVSDGASTLWRLTVVESQSVVDPVILDTQALGTVYVGTGTLVVDGFTGLSRNVSRLRLELTCLGHVRDPFAAYIVSNS